MTEIELFWSQKPTGCQGHKAHNRWQQYYTWPGNKSWYKLEVATKQTWSGPQGRGALQWLSGLSRPEGEGPPPHQQKHCQMRLWIKPTDITETVCITWTNCSIKSWRAQIVTWLEFPKTFSFNSLSTNHYLFNYFDGKIFLEGAGYIFTVSWPKSILECGCSKAALAFLIWEFLCHIIRRKVISSVLVWSWGRQANVRRTESPCSCAIPHPSSWQATLESGGTKKSLHKIISRV